MLSSGPAAGGRAKSATRPQTACHISSAANSLAEECEGCHSVVIELAGAPIISLAWYCKRSSLAKERLARFELAFPGAWGKHVNPYIATGALFVWACHMLSSNAAPFALTSKSMHIFAETCSSEPWLAEPSTTVMSTMSFASYVLVSRRVSPMLRMCAVSHDAWPDPRCLRDPQ